MLKTAITDKKSNDVCSHRNGVHSLYMRLICQHRAYVRCVVVRRISHATEGR